MSGATAWTGSTTETKVLTPVTANDQSVALTLPGEGTTKAYYCIVAASNSNADESDWYTFSFTLDDKGNLVEESSTSTAAVTAPTDGAYLNATGMTTTAVTGTASSGSTGDVAAVKLALAKVGADNSEKFWNGKSGNDGAFDSETKVWAFDATDTGTNFSAWSADLTAVLKDDGDSDGKYKVYAYAQDDNTGVPTDESKIGAKSFVLDCTAPTVANPSGTQVVIAGASPTTVDVTFSLSEALTATNGTKATSEISNDTAVDSGAYTVTKESGATGSDPTPTAVKYKINGENRSIVFTFTKTDLVDKNTYKIALAADKLVDFAGNTAAAQEYTFTAIAGNPLTFDLASTVSYDYDPTETKDGAAITNPSDKIKGYTYAVKSGSSTDVASVGTDGKLTLKGVGTTTITVTANPTDAAAAETVPYVATTKEYDVTVSPYDLKSLIESFKFKKEYDGVNTAAAADIIDVEAVDAAAGTLTVNGETLTLAVSASFSDATVAKNKNVTLQSVTLTDNSTYKAANYEYDGHAFTSGSANGDVSGALNGAGEIEALELEIVAEPASKTVVAVFNKTYDGSDTATLSADAGLSADYRTGVVAADADHAILTIKSGAKGTFDNKNVANGKTVTVKGSDLELTGSAAGNYKLPETVPDIKVTADIAQATPTLSLGNLSQTAGSVTAVTVSSTPASDDLNATVEYEVPVASVTTVTPANCTCYNADHLAHAADCAYVVAYAGDASTTTQCDCGYTGGTADPDKVHDTTAAGGGSDCAYTLASGNHCNCSVRDELMNVEDHASGCGAVQTTPASTEWLEWGGTPTDATWDSVSAYLNSLSGGSTVNVKATSAASTNLAAVSSPVSGTLTINAAINPGGGGGGTAAYKVTFNAGENGKITKGGASVYVNSGAKLAADKVPVVTANDGYKFLGWSLDGKTVVDPTADKVTKALAYTALYERGAGFDKTLTGSYINGYSDGTFRPAMSATRGEVAAMIARIMSEQADLNAPYTGIYSDVNPGDWYAPYIAFLSEKNVIEGYKDGTFRPDQQITRAEFVTMVMRIDGVTESQQAAFSDIAGHWAANYISAATAKGYLGGYPDGTFRPNHAINRAEAVTILNAVLGWSDKAAVGEMKFSDVPQGNWAYDHIRKASNGVEAE
ncbi:MAG: S-layer homology domain-containing protein [Eubacteriales bacterium]|nr:S-layer homology domain-containing protein [Eubacteriales bacterium]